MGDLTAERLKPPAEITEGFKELLFDDNYQKATLTAVQGVMPSLEQRRDGYADPGEDVRGVVSDLLAKLWSPPRRRFSDGGEIESSSSPYIMDRRYSRCALMLY